MKIQILTRTLRSIKTGTAKVNEYFKIEHWTNEMGQEKYIH